MSTNVDNLPRELNRLAHALAKLPREQYTLLEPHFVDVVNAHKRRQSVLRAVQEALGQLRLDMKYLLFDNECLRRELGRKE